MTNETRVATKGQLENFLAQLVDQLDACGFLRNGPKRPGMVRKDFPVQRLQLLAKASFHFSALEQRQRRLHQAGKGGLDNQRIPELAGEHGFKGHGMASQHSL